MISEVVNKQLEGVQGCKNGMQIINIIYKRVQEWEEGWANDGSRMCKRRCTNIFT